MACVTLAGCRCDRRRAGPEPRGEPSAAPSPSPRPKRTRRGESDVTFVVGSDTHFGFGGMEEQNRALIDRVNRVEGIAWPARLGGKVAKPRGLVLTGDLTEWGRVEEWARFEAIYGTRGAKTLDVPLFEMVGNHDKVSGPWVTDQVAARHGGRFYAWDWDDLHLVSLGEAPDDDGLTFLKNDLDTLAPDVPVILFFHLALAGPWSQDNWFAEGTFKARLGDLLENKNVIAIFHGHHHARGHYTWQSKRVFKPGAVKHGAHTIAVVRVTDTRLVVGWVDFDHGDWADSRAYELAAPASR
jgi:hypothetical protein